MAKHAILSLNNTTAVLASPRGIHSGCDITIQNINNSGYIYVGGEGVTTSNYGFRIDPNCAISFELPGKDSIYIIASESLNAAVITIGLEIGN
jgi:hypothetical protein